MQLQQLTSDDGVLEIKLAGRLDREGAEAISHQFAFATTTRAAKIIVDLSQVAFLSSIGIRLLLTTAQAQAKRGGKLVLAAAQPGVQRVIDAAGIDQLIGISADIESARTMFAE